MEGIQLATKQNLEQFLEDNPPEYYYPEALRSGTLTPQEMRTHYSYLRKIANKRLKRFVGSEFEDAQSYIKNVGKFVPLSEINNERELMFKLYEVNKFVRARSSSVTGLKQMRNEAIETFHDRGFTWINKNNIKQFGDYMEYMRSKYGAKQFDSERASELFGMITSDKVGLNVEDIQNDFKFWSKHADELSQLPKNIGKKIKSSKDFQKALSKNKKK